MEIVKRKFVSAMDYLKTFVKWGIIAVFVGIIGGLVGCAFHKSVEYVTEVRMAHEWLIYLLPAGGVLIVFLYKISNMSEKTGTNRVLESVRTDKKVPLLIAPLIFVSTVITHLLGGSAGREGAALQLGGSIGYRAGKIFRLDEKDMHLVVMLGMSGVFAALFGTPLTATFFALEVISVGVIYYVALVPCIVSSVTAYAIAVMFGVEPVRFSIPSPYQISLIPVIQVVSLAVLCAVVSILFCTMIKYSEKLSHRYIKNDYLRAICGGVLIVIMTLLVGRYDYNGAGMDIISKALTGQARPEAFILKILFTVVTISAGFKGGEIVPTFFIGSTLGCFVGSLIGLDPSFAAAIGFVALFCGVVNCPIASIILSIEVFGAESLLFFAFACGVSYMMSGYYGLYSSQKIMYSKLEAKYINIHAK